MHNFRFISMAICIFVAFVAGFMHNKINKRTLQTAYQCGVRFVSHLLQFQIQTPAQCSTKVLFSKATFNCRRLGFLGRGRLVALADLVRGVVIFFFFFVTRKCSWCELRAKLQAELNLNRKLWMLTAICLCSCRVGHPPKTPYFHSDWARLAEKYGTIKLIYSVGVLCLFVVLMANISRYLQLQCQPVGQKVPPIGVCHASLAVSKATDLGPISVHIWHVRTYICLCTYVYCRQAAKSIISHVRRPSVVRLLTDVLIYSYCIWTAIWRHRNNKKIAFIGRGSPKVISHWYALLWAAPSTCVSGPGPGSFFMRIRFLSCLSINKGPIHMR